MVPAGSVSAGDFSCPPPPTQAAEPGNTEDAGAVSAKVESGCWTELSDDI
jgi:hypothetical protein